MRIFHCTKKLPNEIGTPILIDIPTDTEDLVIGMLTSLGLTAGNVFSLLMRRPSIVSSSRMSKKPTSRTSWMSFWSIFSYNLQAEGFDLDIINKVMQEYKEIGFAKYRKQEDTGFHESDSLWLYEVIIKQLIIPTKNKRQIALKLSASLFLKVARITLVTSLGADDTATSNLLHFRQLTRDCLLQPPFPLSRFPSHVLHQHCEGFLSEFPLSDLLI